MFKHRDRFSAPPLYEGLKMSLRRDGVRIYDVVATFKTGDLGGQYLKGFSGNMLLD
jgi:hypothetical protein